MKKSNILAENTQRMEEKQGNRRSVVVTAFVKSFQRFATGNFTNDATVACSVYRILGESFMMSIMADEKHRTKSSFFSVYS